MSPEIKEALARAAAAVREGRLKPGMADRKPRGRPKIAPEERARRRRFCPPWTLSGYKGVYLKDASKPSPWQAKIEIGGESVHLGCYRTPEEAARAYDAAARIRWGNDCFLNFPEER